MLSALLELGSYPHPFVPKPTSSEAERFRHLLSERIRFASPDRGARNRIGVASNSPAIQKPIGCAESAFANDGAQSQDICAGLWLFEGIVSIPEPESLTQCSPIW